MQTEPQDLTKQTVAASSGLFSTHLQRLVYRVALMSLAVEGREKAALSLLQRRRKISTSLFQPGVSDEQAKAAEAVLSRRLSRLNFRPDLTEQLERNMVAAAANAARMEHPAPAKQEVDQALFVARLFDPAARKPGSEQVEQYRNAKPVDLRRLIEAAQGGISQGTLAYLTAALLPGQDIHTYPQSQLRSAKELIRHLQADKTIIDGLREACEDAISDPDREFLLLQMLALLGDVVFVNRSLDLLEGPQMLWIAGLLPESFQWKAGQLLPVAWTAKPRGMVIVGCALPPALQLEAGKKALFTPAAADATPNLAPEQSVVTRYAPEYSKSEDALSAYTAKTAEKLTRSFLSPFRKSRHASLLHMIAAAEIRTDDVLFSSLRQAWALHQAIRTEKPKQLCIYAEDASFAVRLARFAARAVKGIQINIRLIGAPSLVDIDFATEPVKKPKDLVSVVDTWIDQTLPAGSQDSGAQTKARNATLFCGRPFDRNYVTDINRLLPLAAAEGPTHMIVTAGARAKDGVLPTLTDAIPQQAGVTFWTEPESVVRLTAPKLIPAALRDHSTHVVDRVLADEDDPHHLLLQHAEPQLRRHFDRIMPLKFLSAMLIKRIVADVAPRTIVCLPGRDWVSRMVIAEAKARLGAKVKSFDLQTVFIGPRTRYKTTPCDMQIAIETHSASLFKDYFHLPAKRILLGGSIRYAGSLSAARAETAAAGKPVVLFTASPILSACLPVAKALVDVFRRDRSTLVKIRPHPSSTPEDINMLTQVLEPLGGNGMLDNSSTLASALQSAELVVTRFSNTGLEAAMLQKPVIAADFTGERPPIPLDQMGVALRAATPDALARLIRDIRSGGSSLRRLERTRTAYFEQNPQLLETDIAARLWTLMKKSSP